MENRRQHEAGGDDDDETGQDRVGAGEKPAMVRTIHNPIAIDILTRNLRRDATGWPRCSNPVTLGPLQGISRPPAASLYPTL